MKQYLITTDDGELPFFTDFYEHENHFNMHAGMVVYDLINKNYTNDGIQWFPIEEDHL